MFWGLTVWIGSVFSPGSHRQQSIAALIWVFMSLENAVHCSSKILYKDELKDDVNVRDLILEMMPFFSLSSMSFTDSDPLPAFLCPKKAAVSLSSVSTSAQVYVGMMNTEIDVIPLHDKGPDICRRQWALCSTWSIHIGMSMGCTAPSPNSNMHVTHDSPLGLTMHMHARLWHDDANLTQT